MITQKELQTILPANLKSAATQSLADRINNISNDPIFAEQVQNNIVSYTSVMKEGKFKIDDYISACTYVSYKLMGYNNQDAYLRTFPQRHADMVARGLASKDIASYVSAYHKGKLVQLIMEQTLTPAWVFNQDAFQKAINVQVELMQDANSEMVRCQAANSILTHLAKPKDSVPLLNIDLGESTGLNELKDTLTKMAEQQRRLIQHGMTTKEIAEGRIIEVDPND